MSDKPKMYHNVFNKEIHNNKMIFNSYDKNNERLTDASIVNIQDIKNKINDIVTANNFIYSKTVHIAIGDEIIMRKIIGIINDNLVTIDNEYIPLVNIKDIYV